VNPVAKLGLFAITAVAEIGGFGWLVERMQPDRWDIVGALVALAGIPNRPPSALDKGSA
jgi:hypothetical protein